MGTNPIKSYDGHLNSWEEVQDAQVWEGLVSGNGLSINIWPNFGYDSLFDQARRMGLFTNQDEALFKTLGVANFETVLYSLSESIRIGAAFGQERPTELKRHRSIQEALAKAVQGVHITGGEIPKRTFAAIREELRMYRWVFSTSYDLLLYWSAASGEQPFDGFKDYFWARDCNAFDESTIWLHDAAICTRLCFLHGALHLVVLGSGLTRKRTTTGQTLLDQFGRPCGADATARPLIVSEGQASEKKRSIAENDYLTYCWEQLKRREAPLVVFGHSLRDQDSHLIEALNEHPERPLAIGLRDHGAKSNRREKHRIASLRDAERIHFYDSTTYPRGRSELALHEAPWRKHLRPGSGRAA